LGVTDGDFTPARKADMGGKMSSQAASKGWPKYSPSGFRCSREARHVSAGFHSLNLHPQITAQSIKWSASRTP